MKYGHAFMCGQRQTGPVSRGQTKSKENLTSTETENHNKFGVEWWMEGWRQSLFPLKPPPKHFHGLVGHSPDGQDFLARTPEPIANAMAQRREKIEKSKGKLLTN